MTLYYRWMAFDETGCHVSIGLNVLDTRVIATAEQHRVPGADPRSPALQPQVVREQKIVVTIPDGEMRVLLVYPS